MLNHHFGCSICEAEKTAEVEVYVALPAFFAKLQERRHAGAAGVVDENVYFAKLLHGGFHHRLHLGEISHICCDCHALSPRLRYLLGCLLACFGVFVGYHHIGAETGESQSDAFADACSAAGDYRHFVGEEDVRRIK